MGNEPERQRARPAHSGRHDRVTGCRPAQATDALIHAACQGAAGGGLGLLGRIRSRSGGGGGRSAVTLELDRHRALRALARQGRPEQEGDEAQDRDERGHAGARSHAEELGGDALFTRACHGSRPAPR